MSSPRITRVADGSPVLIRPIEPRDRSLLVDGLARLSTRSRRQRFLAQRDAFTSRELDYLVDVDHHDHEALVALDVATGDLIGVARYVRLERRRAELALTVVDAWQGRGVGAALLDRLALHARRAGIRSFESLTLAGNGAAIRALQRLGRTRRVAMGPHERLVTDVPRAWRLRRRPRHARRRPADQTSPVARFSFRPLRAR